jgi:SAM-dependent methyltransferase
MQYFKHSELTNIYHVSLKTVHNWVDAAKQGKVALKLHQTKNRTYIADTPENTLTLKQLSEKGKKYRNSLHHKVIHPKPDFYEIYNRRQILDIITNLNIHGEIPRQYNYLKDGALNWDSWLNRLAKEEVSNILKGTMELIRTNMGAIERLIDGGKKINVIDLGVGNAYPVKELLGYLIDKGVLHRYIAIDISPSMLSIAESNIKKWYGDKAKFEGYVRDISYEHFDDLLVDDMLDKDADETINLVLLLGATPVNFRSFSDVFNAVHSSMGGNDLLMYTDKADTEVSRRYFDFNSLPGTSKLSPSHRYILDLMNVDESLYDAEMGFDSAQRMRYIRVRLKASITIRFNFGDTERTVNLEKGDAILLLRVWHMTALEIISAFEKTGFTLVQSSLTKDRQYFLSISAVETKQS